MHQLSEKLINEYHITSEKPKKLPKNSNRCLRKQVKFSNTSKGIEQVLYLIEYNLTLNIPNKS